MPSSHHSINGNHDGHRTLDVKILDPIEHDEERSAFIELDPSGFFIRHPPKTHQLTTFITPDNDLFQTIHMGAAVVDTTKWKLSITGLVNRPFSLDLATLKSFPSHTITSFHECFGSPLKPPIDSLLRIGNVRWTGVRLSTILNLAEPIYPSATYIWSEGLDRGEFGGTTSDRYQKDLPIAKALRDEVMLVYAINGHPLSKERGGPVRLVVPGWFGTNSTKWISKIEVADRRADKTPFTTRFYNVTDEKGVVRPVWRAEVNSMITKPRPGEKLYGRCVEVEGWAWDSDGVEKVGVSVDGGMSWFPAVVEARVDFSWQKFFATLTLEFGVYTIMARATSNDGQTQPLTGHRNHCHSVKIEVAAGN